MTQPCSGLPGDRVRDDQVLVDAADGRIRDHAGPLPGPRSPASRVSWTAVQVARERCEGHGLCIYAAPAVFDLDADGYASVLVDVVAADQLGDVRRAIESCPASAIALVPAGTAADAGATDAADSASAHPDAITVSPA